MTTPSKGSSGADAAAMQGLETPPAKAMSAEEQKEFNSFAKYSLSPPPKSKKGSKTFEESETKIKREMKKEWDDYDFEGKRIILFLVCRNFRGNSNKPSRVDDIRTLLEPGRIRDRMLQVLKVSGDSDISVERYKHYTASCLVILRYFKQEGAKGFVTDMSTVTYYLRQQKYGSCFLQAACVLISYLVQAHGKKMPPPDGSKLVRHNFTDDQLFKYIVDDEGGDSIAVFRLLEKQFFDCDDKQRPYNSISCRVLKNHNGLAFARESLDQGPGLVAKFKVPSNFKVDRKGNRNAGYARFTEWGREAEFIELKQPSDKEELRFQQAHARKLIESCKEPHPVCSFDSFGELTAATESASVSLEEEVGENYLSHAESECGTVDFEDYFDDVEVSESHGVSNDKADDDSEGKSEILEGDDTFHAMILLGTRIVNGETFWTLQNSWSGMRIIEMSTDYLAKSGGVLVFFGKDGRQVRAKPSSLIQFCPSPIAETSLDRADCEYWDELLTMDDDACLEDGT